MIYQKVELFLGFNLFFFKNVCIFVIVKFKNKNNMFRTLLSLLNDDGLQTRVSEAANSLRKAYSNVYGNFGASFEEEEGNYVFVLNVPDGMTSADVNVEYDDETNLVTVEMSRKTNNFSSNMSWVETLPKDADPDTLSATVVNGVFTLVVDKLPEPEPEPVEEAKADSIVVEVKRKNRKTFEG